MEAADPFMKFSHDVVCILFSGHNFLNIYGLSLERLLDDGLEVPGLVGVG